MLLINKHALNCVMMKDLHVLESTIKTNGKSVHCTHLKGVKFTMQVPKVLKNSQLHVTNANGWFGNKQ